MALLFLRVGWGLLKKYPLELLPILLAPVIFIFGFAEILMYRHFPYFSAVAFVFVMIWSEAVYGDYSQEVLKKDLPA